MNARDVTPDPIQSRLAIPHPNLRARALGLRLGSGLGLHRSVQGFASGLHMTRELRVAFGRSAPSQASNLCVMHDESVELSCSLELSLAFNLFSLGLRSQMKQRTRAANLGEAKTLNQFPERAPEPVPLSATRATLSRTVLFKALPCLSLENGPLHTDKRGREPSS